MAEIRYLNKFITERIDFEKKVMYAEFNCIDTRGVIWHVPKDSETDGKSVPPQLEILIGDPFEGVTEIAAVVHDRYCYIATSKEATDEERKSIRSQRDTHRIFRELVLQEMKKKYPWWQKWTWQYLRAHLMWAAVRAWNYAKHPEWK